MILNDVASVEKVVTLTKMAVKLGPAGEAIFKFGGKAVLPAMEALEKAGKLTAKTLKASMRVGATGLKAVAKGCWKSLSWMLDMIHKYGSLFVAVHVSMVFGANSTFPGIVSGIAFCDNVAANLVAQMGKNYVQG